MPKEVLKIDYQASDDESDNGNTNNWSSKPVSRIDESDQFETVKFTKRDFTAQLIEARTNIERNEEYHQFDDYESESDQPQGKSYRNSSPLISFNFHFKSFNTICSMVFR